MSHIVIQKSANVTPVYLITYRCIYDVDRDLLPPGASHMLNGVVTSLLRKKGVSAV
jgi:hypothetical protein